MTQQFTQGHALLIGVGGGLAHTVADATELATLLADPARCAYPPQQVQLLTGAQATHANILHALDTLAATATADSMVLIYLGAQADAAIDTAALWAKINAIPAQKLLLLLDGYPVGNLLSDLDSIKTAGRAVITSAQLDETLYVGATLSYFAQALLEAFAGAQLAQQDGFVRIADLATYVREQLSLWTLDRQHPSISFAESDNFVLAFYAAGGVDPIGLSNPLEAKSLGLESMPYASAIPPQEKVVVSGEKGVALGGDILESTIVTGDGNRIDQSSRIFDQRGGRVAGDQTNIAGNQHIEQQNVYIVQGGEGWGVPSAQPRAIADLCSELIAESIRLDVATPETVFVDDPFDMAVAIRQPDSPPLAVADLKNVTSEEGEIYRNEASELVLYRVEVSAPNCDIEPSHLTFRLKVGQNSRPRYFHITPKRYGHISIHVNAYQEDDELAAQTRIMLEAAVHAA